MNDYGYDQQTETYRALRATLANVLDDLAIALAAYNHTKRERRRRHAIERATGRAVMMTPEQIEIENRQISAIRKARLDREAIRRTTVLLFAYGQSDEYGDGLYTLLRDDAAAMVKERT